MCGPPHDTRMSEQNTTHNDPTLAMSTRRVEIPSHVEPIQLLGTSDQILRALERGFPTVRFFVAGRTITMTGSSGTIDVAAQLVSELVDLTASGTMLDVPGVEHAIRLLTAPQPRAGQDTSDDIVTADGHTIHPQSPGQSSYIKAIERSVVVFGIGPAGTGKTYLAMAQAVRALLSGEVRRVVLTRPAVEAGENLGFLPGSLTEKIDPYLRPLYDALHDMIDPQALPQLMAAGTIEVAPLAYMRGRTLNDSFIILDEAQNTTPSQMKMFLTRLGFNSHMVVTGDVSQIDLPGGTRSGLNVVQDILTDIDNVEFCYMTSADVVRHPLVGQIIDAYSRWEERAHRQADARSATRTGRRSRRNDHD